MEGKIGITYLIKLSFVKKMTKYHTFAFVTSEL
jgi:hypothetical protein